MSDALYERYKDALRRGHVAALRGRQDAALAAYGEAAKLAPDRPLPLVGIGNVLAGLGKHPEALAAFDAALERAPTDESALRGRADVLVASGDRAGAADTLDRLASALDANGRPSDALDAARRALELAESRGRRAGVKSMVARLTQSGPPGDPTVSETLSRALGILEERVLGRNRGEASAPAAVEDAGEASTAVDERLQGTAAAAESGVAAVAEVADPAAVAEPAEPEPEPEPAPPPFDPVAATAAVEDAAASGDAAATRELAEIATAGHLAAGQLYAAIDVCYLALATNPADPGLHLSLAGLYLDLGWRSTAADKLALLAQLAELDGDTGTRARLCALVAERLPEDPRLAALCA
ncbi:MAG: Tetratricopeptide repeat [Chloroflexota bacterium]|nr:Tetratricopeptide repeat [Chloroflexota bacterium]